MASTTIQQPFDISWWFAILLCLLWTLAYVLSLYVWHLPCCPGKLRRQLPRDDRINILRRIASVTVVTIAVPLVIAFTLPMRSSVSSSSSSNSSSGSNTWWGSGEEEDKQIVVVPVHEALGWTVKKELPLGILIGALSTCLLFAGPLCMQWLEYKRKHAIERRIQEQLQQQQHQKKTTIVPTSSSSSPSSSSSASSSGSTAAKSCNACCVTDERLQGIRDVVIAPVFEEIVFRACMAPILLSSGMPVGLVIAVAPVFFGLAHAHHVRNHVKYMGLTRAEAAGVIKGQVLYTTVFGWFASFLLLRTGSVWSAIVSHAICNIQGVPDFSGALNHPRRTLVRGTFVAGVVLFLVFVVVASIFPLPFVDSVFWAS